MKIEEIKIKMKIRNEVICKCLASGYKEEALILLYSTMDSVSWLYSNETNIDNRKPGKDFRKFTKDFFLPCLPGYDISAEELYLARCAVVHTSSSLSSNQKNNRQFELMFTPLNTNRIKKLNETKSIYNTNQSDNLISSVKKIFLYNSKNRFDTEFI